MASICSCVGLCTCLIISAAATAVASVTCIGCGIKNTLNEVKYVPPDDA